MDWTKPVVPAGQRKLHATTNNLPTGMMEIPLTDWERSQLGKEVFSDNGLDSFEVQVCRFMLSVTPG
jgi:hypothetical protein